MAIERFIDEIGTDLNKFQVTTSSGDTYEITLLRKANISQVGTLLNATKLNELVDEINRNTSSIANLSTVARTGSYSDLSNKPSSLPASDVYSWAKESTKPSYNASEVGTYTTSEIDTKLDEKQNKISNTNRLDYSLLQNVPTALSDFSSDLDLGDFTNTAGYAKSSAIPTKLSDLTNDNGNMYMNKSSWTSSSQLPSRGLYILKVYNNQVFGGGYINLGLVYYNGDNLYWSIYYGGQNYRVYITANGGVNFQQWTGNTVANLSGTTNYYYIKLS